MKCSRADISRMCRVLCRAERAASMVGQVRSAWRGPAGKRGECIMRVIRHVAAVGAIGLGLLPLAATAAGAAPTHAKNASLAKLTCGATTYDIVTIGGDNTDNTTFTPAHLLASNGALVKGILVPVQFNGFAGTFSDITTSPPTVLQSFNDPTIYNKGNTPNVQKNLFSCTYTITQTFTATADDPSQGIVAGHTYQFQGTGGVTGFAPGKPA
jgi:hypothetical protein